MLPKINKNKNWLRITTTLFAVFVVVVFLFSTVNIALAQITTPDVNNDTFGVTQVDNNIALAGTDLRVVVMKIIRAIFGLLSLIAVSLIIYAGYTIMTSGGEEEKITKAKKIMINAVIGLAIMMSAVIIVQFIINALTGQGGFGFGGGGGGGRPVIETFAGSGSLGKAIKDHYPARGQTGVKRNSKIFITFAPAINPATIIENTNRTCWTDDNIGPTTTCKTISGSTVTGETAFSDIAKPYYGDCKDDGDFSWTDDCDHLLTNKISIYKSDDENKTIVGAVALTIYEANGEARNFVFRPFEALGDNLQDVWYTVAVTNDIKRITGEGVFDNQYYKYYSWEFQTDTSFDFSPPTVISVSPKKFLDEKDKKTIPKNSVIRINFSEAMDPTSVQGVLGSTGLFTNIIFSNINMAGEWQVSNGYKTVEFVSSEECGMNSCGDLMYCLNLTCQEKNCVEDFKTLIRTATLLPGTQTFEAEPFSGVMDASGNALDGDADNVSDGNPPKSGNFKSISDGEDRADNYLWSYNVQNKIDRTAPYIEKVLPGLDAGSVPKNAKIEINFSKSMRYYTLSNMFLEEYPNTNSLGEIMDFGYNFDSDDKNEKTVGRIIPTRDLGPNGENHYYYPQIPSNIMDNNFNCLYPGQGPVRSAGDTNLSPICTIEYNDAGEPISIGANCVSVTNADSTDTGCVQTTNPGNLLQPNINICVNYMKTISPDLNP